MLSHNGGIAASIAIAWGAFGLGTLIAELAGAANLGTAMTFGQIAFAVAVTLLLLRRSGSARPLTSADAPAGSPTAPR